MAAAIAESAWPCSSPSSVFTARPGVWGMLGACPGGGVWPARSSRPTGSAPQGCSAVLSSVSGLLVEFHLKKDYHDLMKVWRPLLRQFYQILKYFILHSFPLEDELTGILKKLSLEKYQPIFEEQEVSIFFLCVHLNLSVKQLSKYVGCHSLSLDWSFSLRWLKK